MVKSSQNQHPFCCRICTTCCTLQATPGLSHTLIPVVKYAVWGIILYLMMMGNKVKRTLRHFIGLIVLLPLLVACDAGPSGLQEWITNLVRGSAPADQDPATPQALPTPTLAVREDATAAAADQPTLPSPATLTPEAQTSPTVPATDAPEPFTGTFVGAIFGDEESSADLQLDLQQDGRQIEGVATVGEGLVVNAGGLCGSIDVPAMTLNASDELDRADGREISTTSTVQVEGFEVPVELRATLALDGKTLLAEATMYPPAFCGADPTMTATLIRVEGN